MATATVTPETGAAAAAAAGVDSSLPDFLTDPDAVLKDTDTAWRHGHVPDYTRTRASFHTTKRQSHQTGSLPQLVENLVKNWEVEASFKLNLDDWRTIDLPNFSFAVNGGPPQTAEYMLHAGTYNTILTTGNQWYSAAHSDLAASHRTFKQMMPTFAWEVVEVYSGPPQVAFKWRHWGEMQNDYVGINDQGQKVTVKAHGGAIEIHGVTVANVDERVRLRKVETWFDPMEMFRQITAQTVIETARTADKSQTEGGLVANLVSGLTGPTCPVAAELRKRESSTTAQYVD